MDNLFDRLNDSDSSSASKSHDDKLIEQQRSPNTDDEFGVDLDNDGSSSFGSLVHPGDSDSDVQSSGDETIEVLAREAAMSGSAEYVRLPGYVNISDSVFSVEAFEREMGDLPKGIQEHHLVAAAVSCLNTVRWRRDSDGQKLESNSAIIEWEDGSRSLRIGNQMFDIERMTSCSDNNQAFIRCGDTFSGLDVLSKRILVNSIDMDERIKFQVNQAARDRRKGTGEVDDELVFLDMRNPEIIRWEQIRKTEKQSRADDRRRNAQLRRREAAANKVKNLKASYLETGSDQDLPDSSDDDEVAEEDNNSETEVEIGENIDNEPESEVEADDKDDEKPANKLVRIEESDDEDDE